MSVVDQFTTTVSTRGRVVLPGPVRRALRWGAGTRLAVEKTPEGVLLRPLPVFAETSPEDVFACLACDGPPRSVAEMEAGVLAEAKLRHAGG